MPPFTPPPAFGSLASASIRRVACGALVLLGSALMAACGLNGTDRENEAEPSTVAPPSDPDLTAFEVVEISDSEPREQMRLQVVLDRLGFGPGVIDGREGISTSNALKGFQEANDIDVTGKNDEPTRKALVRWSDRPATRVVRIPESWDQIAYRPMPEDVAKQAAMQRLGYETLEEKLAERFHTTVETLQALNPGGRPAGSQSTGGAVSTPEATGQSPGQSPIDAPQAPHFRAGQLVRVPNVGLDGAPSPPADDADWSRTLASLGVSAEQPDAAKVVVDKSEGWLKVFDREGKLMAMFTVTSGSEHDPLPLGEWGINGISRNPDYSYDPALLRNAPASDGKQQLPPGPNSPVGVVWIDLTKEHYGIHGTPDPKAIGRAQSNGCVRLTNWDAARLAQMVSNSTEVLFQA